MITAELTYRTYEDKDLPGILQLWEQYSGWGAITLEQFDKWYLQTPYGPCVVIVAVNNEEEIVGKIAFIPAIINLNGREIKAIRGSAPILNPECRRFNLNQADHPAFAMIKEGMKAGAELGYELLYSFPAQGWIALLRAFPRYGMPDGHVALYECFTLSLETNYIPPAKNIKTAIFTGRFSEEYDQLWKEAVTGFPLSCAIKRGHAWLNWKILNHLILECRSSDKNELLGYVAINKSSGLIIDMLARTKEDLQEVLQSVVHSLHVLNPERVPIELKKLKGMLTPSIQGVIDNMPSEKEQFTFSFFCYALKSSVEPKTIHPSNWYMMPND